MIYKPNKGDILLGKYEIETLVGEGAFGGVYRARFLKLDRDVAIKFINPNNQILERFVDELDAIKKLDHPNIVRLFDYDILKNGVPCIIMEFVEGRELGDVLVEHGPFACSDICEIALQVVDALVETHKKGIIHCDLKPENIMLTSVGARDNVIKLIDFGVASILSEANESSDREHMLIGTPQYMAPEQILHKPLGPWTDIYAIGLILIEMFTGRFVFDSDDPREVLRMQLYTPVEIPHALACTELGDIIARATEKEVSKRYNNTQDLYDDLRAAAASLQNGARPAVQEMSGSWRRNRSVHSIFSDIDDLLMPAPGAQRSVRVPSFGAGRAVPSIAVPELAPPNAGSRRPSFEVPLMTAPNNAGTPAGGDGALNGDAPASDVNRAAADEFDLSSLNLGGFQSALDDLTPGAKQRMEKLGDKSAAAKHAAGGVPELKPEDKTNTPQDNAPPLLAAAAPQSQTAGRKRPEPVKNKVNAALEAKNDSALSRIEQAAELAIQHNASAAPAAVETDLGRAMVSTARVEKKKVSNALRNVIIAVIAAVVLAGIGGYLRSSGMLEELGLADPKPADDHAPDEAPAEASKSFVQYSTIRDAASKMAYVSAISGYLGTSRDVEKYVEYRVIGTPTDAAIYLNGSVVCGKTPCKIRVYGPIEKMKLDIRKGSKSTMLDMTKKTDPALPIIMVIK